MKNFFCFVFYWLVSLTFIGYCPQLLAEDKPAHVFRIGVSLPLTGDLAEYGSAVRNGIQLAQSRFPSKFQHLDLLYEDNRYDGKTALTILQKFRASNVDLIYSWGEIPFNAIAPIIEKSKVPLTAYSLDNKAAVNSKFIILTSNPISLELR